MAIRWECIARRALQELPGRVGVGAGRGLLEGGWAPTVADGGFTHEYSAPSAGPPPWYVYEFMPEDAYAVATKEPGGATRWTF